MQFINVLKNIKYYNKLNFRLLRILIILKKG